MQLLTYIRSVSHQYLANRPFCELPCHLLTSLYVKFVSYQYLREMHHHHQIASFSRIRRIRTHPPTYPLYLVDSPNTIRQQ